jgi:protein required for attachment to host cells
MPSRIEWALVADAQHARILEREAPAGAWRERLEDRIEITDPRSHEQGSDRPGRSHESASSARHAIEPRTDPHREAKRAFAIRLARHLEASEASYARLLLVAPPAFLGDLREALGDAARRKLQGTLDKDLTALKLAELGPRLDEARPA